jgi:hydroxyacylglutathione hydrolase
MIEATGAKLLAHANAKNSIDGIDVGLNAGDVVKIGKTVDLLALDTPGHTMSHVCMLSQTDTPALFSGDTLFNAGAGNCHGGGHPEELYETFARQLEALPENTIVYPGHDYITHDPDHAMVTSLAQEKEFNTFFRLTSRTVIARLREAFPDLPDEPSPKELFLKLRELRNSR